MLRRSLSIFAALIASCFTLYFYSFSSSRSSFSTGPFPMDWSFTMPEEDTAFGGLFFHPYVDDSLPHYQYQRLQDSFMQKKQAIELNNRSIGGGKEFGAIGIYEIKKDWKASLSRNIDNDDPLLKLMHDSLTSLGEDMLVIQNKDSLSAIEKLQGEVLWRINVRSNEIIKREEQTDENMYYFALNGYSFKDHNTKFFIDNNNSYNLAYVVWDSVERRTFDSTKVGHYERKQIAVRYSTDDKRILVPITKSRYNFYNTAVDLFTYIFIFLFFYFFVGLPLQIIVNISKGEPFHKKNIYRFKLMAWALFIYTLLALIIPYVLKFIYRDVIPSEFVLDPFIYHLQSRVYLFLIAIGLFVVGKAFERGHRIQKENALTI